jgi:hypothetical protein
MKLLLKIGWKSFSIKVAERLLAHGVLPNYLNSVDWKGWYGTLAEKRVQERHTGR